MSIKTFRKVNTRSLKSEKSTKSYAMLTKSNNRLLKNEQEVRQN